MPPSRLSLLLAGTLCLFAAAPAHADDVSVTSPTPGARVSDSVRVTAHTSPALPVVKVAFLADARAFATDRTAPYEARWDAAAAADGRHELKAQATLVDGSKRIGRVEVLVGDASKALFVGDFATGDLSQWQGRFSPTASLGGDRLQVVEGPGAPGFAARFEVRQGDRPVASGGDRNEVINQDRLVNGVVPGDGPRYYTWETFIPADYPFVANAQWQTITQWHQAQVPAPSPLKVMLADGGQTFALRGRSAPGAPDETLAAVAVRRGEWHRWVVGVDWSADPAEGWVEAWVDGVQVLDRTTRATQYAGPDGAAIPNHFKQGLYRDSTIAVDQALYLRGTRVGLTRASVDPASARSARRRGKRNR